MSCAWLIDVSDCCDDVAADDPRIERVIQQVVEMMRRWSGYAFGGCPITLRPLEPCMRCRSGCCGAGDCIILHDATSVVAVRVHGETIDPAQWRFDRRGMLCAVPPLRWPSADPRFEEVGALEVDVLTGTPPDAWTMQVATELACELLKSCTGDETCRLPDNAIRVTAQGVTVELTQDELTYLLPSVAAWVRSVNPQRSAEPARIFSPEADRAVVMGKNSPRRYPW